MAVSEYDAMASWYDKVLEPFDFNVKETHYIFGGNIGIIKLQIR